VVPLGSIFLGKWRSCFAGNSDGKMSVQSACVLNTRYFSLKREVLLQNMGYVRRFGVLTLDDNCASDGIKG
jgi:hypothetical protein